MAECEKEHLSGGHRQVPIHFHGRETSHWTWVDEGVHPLITEMLRAGIFTVESCQGYDDEERDAYIAFLDKKGRRLFERALRLASDAAMPALPLGLPPEEECHLCHSPAIPRRPSEQDICAGDADREGAEGTRNAARLVASW